jgi:hypothetical protein
MLMRRTVVCSAALVLTMAGFAFRAGAVNGGWTLLAWNNLGMHCMDSDYSVFSILPPFNTLNAHLIDANGKLLQSAQDITVTYEAIADPTGSINSTSREKTNFWDTVATIFGAPLTVDAGLAGQNMPGSRSVPQRMIWDSASHQFTATGIPITPYDDRGQKNYYPIMHVVARDVNQAILATTDVVLPVSDEMDCRSCHASGSLTAARPSADWANDPDPERDYRINILRLHDDRAKSRPAFAVALAAHGYNIDGLAATVVTNGKPILCAGCHASNALDTKGNAGVPPLTQAVHGMHGQVTDPVTGSRLDNSTDRTVCYRCHPGSDTRCLRGAMGSAVAADGSLAIQCQDCHGPMSAVGAPSREGWLDEPACQNCHTGTAMANSGQIRFYSAFDSTGFQRVSTNATFATNANTPAPGFSLFRFSSGHGGLQCEACHGATHAEYPSLHGNDNIQSLQMQGHRGVMADCTACHNLNPITSLGGPHGMHPIGQSWANNHDDAAEHGGIAQCQACHGSDFRGTVLSRALGDRSLSTRYGLKGFWRGFQVGCYACHNGPGGGTNANTPAVAADSTASTSAGSPVSLPLFATDTNTSSLVLRIVSQPQSGRVALSNRTATYLPDPGFAGTDTFTFSAWDGMVDSNLGTITVSVASQFLLPFYQADENSYTGIAVSNYSAKSTNVRFSGLSPDGHLLPFANNPVTYFLAPQSQLAKLGSEIFGIAPSSLQAGWIRISGDIAELGSISQWGDFSGTQLDGASALEQPSRQLRFTRVYEGPGAFQGKAASTFVSMANPGSTPVTMTLSLLGSQPNQFLAPMKVLTLPPDGAIYGTVSQIFQENVNVTGGSLLAQVTSGDGIVGFEMIRFPEAKTVVGLNGVTGGAPNQSYSAQVAISPKNFTNIKLINTSTMSRSVMLHLIADNGSEPAPPVSLNLAVGQALERDAGQLFGLASAIGSLRVDASGPGVIGDVIFGDPANLASAAAAPLQTQRFSQALFSHVANGANFWTGLAVLNPNDQAATVTLDVISEAGIRTGSISLALAAGNRFARVLSEPTMVPASSGQMRGFIMLHSTLPVIGQELFGDTSMSFLSAVPPKILR